jgi:hypothetical protein
MIRGMDPARLTNALGAFFVDRGPWLSRNRRMRRLPAFESDLSRNRVSS